MNSFLIRDFCTKLSNNKNMLMLISTLVYIIAVSGVLSSNIFLCSFLITLLFAIFIFGDFFRLKYVLIWTFIFYFGVLNTSLRLKDTDELLNLAPVNSEISGTIVSIPQGFSENKPKFFFKVNSIKFGEINKIFKDEKALVTINITPENEAKLKDLRLYNSFKMNGRLSKPFIAGNPSQFDYGNYLRNYNTYAVFYANDFELLSGEKTVKEKFLQSINNYREEVINTHSKYMQSPNLEILGGIVFGDDAVSPSKEIKQSFINSGLLHILAASGMNVAFIYSFFYMLMSILRINYKIKVIIGIFTVIIYSLMTGLGASVIRAALMLIFVLIGKLIDRDANSVALLSFIALLMLFYNPLYINDVGFQLSFVVTLGIILMAPAFTNRKNRIADFFVSSITIPIIAQIWVIPIQIFYFNNISLYSVFANIMSVPILMVISFGGFVSSLLSAIKPLADVICMSFDFILSPLITILVNISDFWGQLPNSAIQTTHPSVFQLILYYGIIMSVTTFLYKEIREKYFKPAITAILSCLLILIVTIIPIKNNNLEITAFDVGNADCFIIKTPSDRYIMVDTGKTGYKGGKSQAEIIMLKYFKDIGIKSLDSIIITHFDNDHCGGAVDLLNKLKVKKIYVNDTNHDSMQAKNIYKSARNRGTSIVKSYNKQIVYKENDLIIENYQNYVGKSDNDNSIITLLSYKDFTMLFTGDAGINGINSVIHLLPSNITVLKVPHHGAVGGLDKNIVNKLNPVYSIISTGENKFGHPSLYTLKLLKNSNVLRTDVLNSIRFKIYEDKYEVYYFDSLRGKYKKYDTDLKAGNI